MTEYQAHQVAYLTLHGWECDPDGVWTKDGEYQYLENNVGRECRTTKFDLDDAYWREVE